MEDEELQTLDDSLDEAELQAIEDSLDEETLRAMEEALAEVEAEANREKSDDELLARYIKDVTLAEELAALADLKAAPPEGVTPERVTEILAHPEESPFFETIKSIRGKKDVYYYDSANMTDHFAKIQSIMQEKDILESIASAARHDCKIYPRPVKVTAMMDSPYFFTKGEIFGALEAMKQTEEYQDIDTVTASNGKICIYSSKYMSKKYAQALCEEMEVEWINHL